jgi:uncharacterized protein (UPF0335 family)
MGIGMQVHEVILDISNGQDNLLSEVTDSLEAIIEDVESVEDAISCFLGDLDDVFEALGYDVDYVKSGV